MFGQDMIFGQKTIKIDEKGRIILPNFTYVESKDILLLGISDNDGNFKIFLRNDIINIINGMIEEQKTTDELKRFKFLTEQINGFQSSFLTECVVDNQKRVTIPVEIREELNLEDSLYICGGTDFGIPCLNLYRKKEDMVKRLCKTKHYENS